MATTLPGSDRTREELRDPIEGRFAAPSRADPWSMRAAEPAPAPAFGRRGPVMQRRH
jgi:hypothetical protein